ncbi:putative ETS translocation variant 3-like protein, partial [Naja naja]
MEPGSERRHGDAMPSCGRPEVPSREPPPGRLPRCCSLAGKESPRRAKRNAFPAVVRPILRTGGNFRFLPQWGQRRRGGGRRETAVSARTGLKVPFSLRPRSGRRTKRGEEPEDDREER